MQATWVPLVFSNHRVTFSCYANQARLLTDLVLSVSGETGESEDCKECFQWCTVLVCTDILHSRHWSPRVSGLFAQWKTKQHGPSPGLRAPPRPIDMHSWPGRCKNSLAGPELEMVTECSPQLLGFWVLPDTSPPADGEAWRGARRGAEPRSSGASGWVVHASVPPGALGRAPRASPGLQAAKTVELRWETQLCAPPATRIRVWEPRDTCRSRTKLQTPAPVTLRTPENLGHWWVAGHPREEGRMLAWESVWSSLVRWADKTKEMAPPDCLDPGCVSSKRAQCHVPAASHLPSYGVTFADEYCHCFFDWVFCPKLDMRVIIL